MLIDNNSIDFFPHASLIFYWMDGYIRYPISFRCVSIIGDILVSLDIPISVEINCKETTLMSYLIIIGQPCNHFSMQYRESAYRLNT